MALSRHVRRLAMRLPAAVLVGLARAKSRYRWLEALVAPLARAAGSGEGVVAHGPAAGLRIDATGAPFGYVLGTADPDEQEWLDAHVGPGDVVYDVGANVGFHTLLCARLVGPLGAVYAFEPFPRNAAQLRRNVVANGFAHAHVEETALGATSGMVMIGDEAGRNVSMRIGGGTEAEVSCTTVDQWRSQNGAPAPSLLKIDVEGAEIDVLRGALQTIRESTPTLLVEVHWQGPDFPAFVTEALAPLGYSAGTLAGDPLPTTVERYHAVLDR